MALASLLLLFAAALHASSNGANVPSISVDSLERSLERERLAIVNGLATQEFPSVALLVIADGDGFHTCSGTLIGCSTILTAAHCVCQGVPGAACDPTFSANLHAFFQHYGTVPIVAVDVHPDWTGSITDGHDLALAHLATALPIRPAGINRLTPADPGLRAVIAGFGRTRDDSSDAGIKRAGTVELAACPEGAPPSSLCWPFSAPLGSAGEDSNTCKGDSGGPLFLEDDAGGSVVGGVTSFGFNPTCLEDDLAVDADVFADREWILAALGDDAGREACTTVPDVGTPESPDLHFGGRLSADMSSEFWSFDVPAGTELLAVTLNGENSRFVPSGAENDFELSVHSPGAPVPSCRPADWTSLEACLFEAPAPGSWTAGAEWYQGAGDYQLTVTLYGGAEGVDPPGDPLCVSDATHLCLGERFRVGIEFLDSAGVESRATATTLTADTGTFWFFEPDNVEVVVKVLDGCTINDHLWVFAAGLTDVELVLTVENTSTGETRRYFNLQGEPFRPVQDITAFATCDVPAAPSTSNLPQTRR